MSNRNLKKGLVIPFLMFLVLPLQVTAAEAALTKELIITATDETDYKIQAEQAFASQLKEDGKNYTLDKIDYEVTDTEYLDTKEKVLDVEGEPDQTVTEDGIEYTLVRSEQKEREDQGIQTVTAFTDYDHFVTRADVSEEKTVTAKNEWTGEEEQVVCSLTGISAAGTETVANTITITVSNYDAAYYEWNGHYIARNDETPQLAGYESELLASVGAEEGSYITGIYWTGDPYTVDGVMYRDAAADVEQQVQVYRAGYQGTIREPEKAAIYTATYSAPDPDGEVELTVKAVASYSQDTVPVFNYFITAVIIGLILAAIFLLIYLFMKRKQKKEGQKGTV